MRKWLFLFIALLLVVSSALAGIQKYHDDARKATTYRQIIRTVGEKQDDRYRFEDYVSFDVKKEIADSTGDSILYMSVWAIATDGLDIRRGDTLELNIDGTSYYLKCNWLLDYKQVYGKVSVSFLPGQTQYLERPAYDVDPVFLYKLADAKKVLIDLHGRNRHFTGRITSPGIGDIRAFCKKHVARPADSPPRAEDKK